MQIKESIWNYGVPIATSYYIFENSKLNCFFDLFFNANLTSPSYNYFLELAATLTGTFFITKITRKLIIASLLRYQGFITKPKSISTKIWAVLLKSVLFTKPTFNQYENSLPRLPLPSVKHTVDLVSKVTGPTILANSGPERHEKFKKACEQMVDFSFKSQMLLKFKRVFSKSWLADIWLDHAYLGARGPLVPTSNYFCGEGFQKCEQTQSARAANVIFWTMRFFDELENDNLDALMLNNLMAGATRVPGKTQDKLVRTVQSKHVAILISGKIFILYPYQKKVLSSSMSIENSISEILEISQKSAKKSDKKSDNKSTEKSGIASLTALPRTEWANLRATAIPKDIITQIESARFCVTLDPKEPKSPHQDLEFGCFGGVSGNTWYDKSISINVHKSGRLSFNCEHACGEATMFGLYRMWVCQRDRNASFELIDDSENLLQKNGVCEFHELETEELRTKLSAEIRKSVEYLESQRLNLKIFAGVTPYGKDWIKKQKISPDSFMQVILQKTFYKINGYIPKMYTVVFLKCREFLGCWPFHRVFRKTALHESGSLALYYLGRTETIRTISEDSINFCKKSTENSMRNACKKIAEYKGQVALANAADRHMFGLYCAGKYLGQKFDLFEEFEEIWRMDTLSTSSTPVAIDLPMSKQIFGGGFAPQRTNGFGVSYFYPFGHTFLVNISSQVDSETDAYGFAKVLWDTMVETRQLFEGEYECRYKWDDLPSFFDDRLDGKHIFDL